MTLKIENATAVKFDEWKGLMISTVNTVTTVTVSPRYWIDAAAQALSDSIDKQILGNVYDEYPIYKDGTKLLRDAAMAAEKFHQNSLRTRSGWKSRYEIRNV